MKLCVLDFETANQHLASACSLGIVVLSEGELIKEWVSLIQPHPAYDYFNPINIKIHNITAQQVKDAPTFAQIYPELLDLFSDSILMAHNANFDMSVLRQLIHLYGLQMPDIHYIDSLEVARKCYPNLRNHKLNTVCEYLSIQLNHHEALSDALGSAMIALNAMIDVEEFDLQQWIKGLNLRLLKL